MRSLSQKQRQSLVDILTEDHGSHLERTEFEEAMMNYFDDISGFETIRATQLKSVINNLWRMYRDSK
jgi:hypothetical protein